MEKVKIKNYPYKTSKDYKDLYNYLMYFDTQFIIALSFNKDNDTTIFQMRKNCYGIITVTDGYNYTKHFETEKDFVDWCNVFNINWIIPS